MLFVNIYRNFSNLVFNYFFQEPILLYISIFSNTCFFSNNCKELPAVVLAVQEKIAIVQKRFSLPRARLWLVRVKKIQMLIKIHSACSLTPTSLSARQVVASSFSGWGSARKLLRIAGTIFVDNAKCCVPKIII